MARNCEVGGFVNSAVTEKCPLAVNGSHQQELPLGAFQLVFFWEWRVTKELAAL